MFASINFFGKVVLQLASLSEFSYRVPSSHKSLLAKNFRHCILLRRTKAGYINRGIRFGLRTFFNTETSIRFRILRYVEESRLQPPEALNGPGLQLEVERNFRWKVVDTENCLFMFKIEPKSITRKLAACVVRRIQPMLALKFCFLICSEINKNNFLNAGLCILSSFLHMCYFENAYIYYLAKVCSYFGCLLSTLPLTHGVNLQ